MVAFSSTAMKPRFRDFAQPRNVCRTDNDWLHGAISSCEMPAPSTTRFKKPRQLRDQALV
jgi:hypothetical protein